MKYVADNLIVFYRSLRPPEKLPKGVEILFPQKNDGVMQLVKQFFKKYYNDSRPRRLIFGINPGRYGAGITGINFTAPKQLKEYCGIDHSFKLSSELSAEFIYEVIEQYGGVKKFYSDWFISAVCPLGFITSPGSSGRPFQRGKAKNINYYDDRNLQTAVTPFIIDSIQKQISFGFKTDYCLCVGGEKNYKFFSSLNGKHKWFGKILPLPHPRFILQYRRKQKEKYIHQYLSALRLAD
jgi:hypothetical protein